MRGEDRRCAWCAVKFTPKRSNSRCCSVVCRNRHNDDEQNARKRAARPPRVGRPARQCSLGWCDKPHAALGYCIKHITQIRKRGSIIDQSDWVCAECGVSIAHLGIRARYCCMQHKKNAAGRRFIARNPDYRKRYVNSESSVAWKAANRDRLRVYARAQQARYRLEHPGAFSEWLNANPDKRRLYNARRRARAASEACLVTERDLRRLVGRYDGRCAYCHRKFDALHLDHVIPLARGGRHSIGNLLPACRYCNSSKNADLLYRWNVRVLLTMEAERLTAAGW